MNNIDMIMYLIDWDRSEDEQQQGLDMARDVKCIRAFFQPSGPGYCKSVWENCARIVCERSDAELIPYLLDMLMWLQDLNWPGALQIMQRLLRFSDVEMLSMTIEDMLPALRAIDEVPWLMSIAGLLDNSKLKQRLNSTTVRILTEYRRTGDGTPF